MASSVLKKVTHWLNVEFPRIKLRTAEALNAECGKGAEIQWCDETGFRSDDIAGRSYSHRGVKPVREVSGSRYGTNVISGITSCGKFRYMMYRGSMTSAGFTIFFCSA